MDKAASAPERAENRSANLAPPEGWAEVQNSLAATMGLALLLVAGRQPPSVLVSHNNSICRAFQSSETHAHLCEPFCGRAFDRAIEAGKVSFYRCHAGLNCFTMPVNIDPKKPLAVIGGRAFLRSADYRALAERVRTGDLIDLLSPELFANVIFALEQDLDDLAVRVDKSAVEFASDSPVAKKLQGEGADEAKKRSGDASAAKSEKIVERAKEEGRINDAEESKVSGLISEKTNAKPVKSEKASQQNASETSFAATPHTKLFAQAVTLVEACERAVKSLCEASGLKTVAVMLRTDEKFVSLCASGQFREKPPRVSLKAKEIKLLQAATHGESIAVPAGGRTATRHEDSVDLFPLLVGEEIKGALLVGDRNLSEEQRLKIVAFCREIALPLEVMRLREELERRMRTATHLRAFVERINSVQPEEAYQLILRHSADLLNAERGSLLLFDEAVNELEVKATVGPHAAVARESRMRLGEGVAGSVLSDGRPLVVSDVAVAQGDWKPAPSDRSYKTKSFISYPLIVSGRKVGVLNITDKAGGGIYTDVDLNLLDMIAPQMALALDRAQWHQKATEFQLLSITDSLTGLLNRRYLEERLSEELERSKRHRFQMSFMMVDIDDFKHYNDMNGHQAGDLALEMTAQCLKSALRTEDVAARYGGEEFSVLLPQTGLSEALVIGERIRRRIERTQFPHGKEQPSGLVTVSIGISSYATGVDTPASVIFAADQALYSAKSRGKNRVEAFEPEKLSDADA